jgi:hypothetical protein
MNLGPNSEPGNDLGSVIEKLKQMDSEGRRHTLREILIELSLTPRELEEGVSKTTSLHLLLDEFGSDDKASLKYVHGLAISDRDAFLRMQEMKDPTFRGAIKGFLILGALAKIEAFMDDYVNRCIDFIAEYRHEVEQAVDRIVERLPFIDKGKQIKIYWNSPVVPAGELYLG